MLLSIKFPNPRFFAVIAMMGMAVGSAGEPIEKPEVRWAPDGPGGTPSFSKHITPLFNKAGCSTRECHGSFQGQNGFRLSLFGYDRAMDFKELTSDTENDEKGGNPRPRIDIKNPDQSLALRKPLEEVEHEGGQKLKRGTWQHRMFREWIAAGAPFDAGNEPYLEKLELDPPELQPEAKNPESTRLLAHFSDGDTLDVTALSRFSSNDKGIAKVSQDGTVLAAGATGDTHIVASYGAEVATSQVLVPNPAGLKHFPEFEPHNPLDEKIAAKLRKLGIQPSETCSDEAFLRRSFVDLIGTLPTPGEAHAFLTDPSPHKRTRLVNTLLDREEYALYWATKWSDWTGNNKGCLNPNYKVTWLWHDWFVDKFSRNVPYDQLARGIVVASSLEGRSFEEYKAENDSVASRINTMAGVKKNLFDDGTYGRRKTLDLFWMRRGGTPEEMAIRSAGIFLGIKFECAQCHKHPFARWTQADFESFASFFRVMDVRSLDGSEKGNRMDYHQVAVYPGIYRNGLEGGKVKAHPPKIPGGELVGYDPESKMDPREKLWEWMVAPDNPHFAPSIVNRIWGHYFGRGIVDPVDDFNAANPPSNPELLDWLAKDFIAHDFDLKHLHRRILTSRTYQLSHLPNPTNLHDRRHFSHAIVRRVPAEVLFDAMLAITGTKQKYSTTFVPPDTRMIAMGATTLGNSTPEYVMRIFGRPKREQASASERSNEAGLTQALYLLNDADLLEKIADPNGNAAKLAREFPSGTDDRALADRVYLMVLSRFPNPIEAEYVVEHLRRTHSTREQAIQDVLWSLMNVREFLFVK